MASRLGAHIVQYSYRVDPLRHDELNQCLQVVRDYARDLGLASFEVWIGESDPWAVVEWHGYDSWSHAQRLASKPAPPDVQAVYERMERLIEGGLRSIQEHAWTPWSLQDSDS